MKEAIDAGVAFINISPIRDDLSADAVEWLMPRPGTDVAILLGLSHTLIVEGLHDRAFLERYCVGFDQFAKYVTGESDGTPKTAEWAADISGLDAEILRALARRMASQRTMISVSWSLTRQDHG